MKNTLLSRINSKFSIILIVSLTWFLFSCGGGHRNSTPSNYDELSDLVESREFEIIHDWAQPMQGGNINLIGNANFIRFEGDSINLFLPYFGVRHSGGAYGGEAGIEYEGPPENLKVKKEDSRILLSFEGDQDSENLRFLITLFPNGNATTSVSSSQRQVISYRGDVREHTPGKG